MMNSNLVVCVCNILTGAPSVPKSTSSSCDPTKCTNPLRGDPAAAGATAEARDDAVEDGDGVDNGVRKANEGACRSSVNFTIASTTPDADFRLPLLLLALEAASCQIT